MPANRASFRTGEFADLWKLVADTPDPIEFARYLPAHVAEILTSKARVAWNGTVRDTATLKILRPLGLADYASYNLTVFGADVRRALLSGEA